MAKEFKQVKRGLEILIAEQRKMLASLAKAKEYLAAGQRQAFIDGLEQGLSFFELLEKGE